MVPCKKKNLLKNMPKYQALNIRRKILFNKTVKLKLIQKPKYSLCGVLKALQVFCSQSRSSVYPL